MLGYIKNLESQFFSVGSGEGSDGDGRGKYECVTKYCILFNKYCVPGTGLTGQQ